MRVPARLQPHQLKDFFDASTVNRIMERVWGKNITFIATAVSGKHYWVSFSFKDWDRQWIQTKVARPGKDGLFY